LYVGLSGGAGGLYEGALDIDGGTVLIPRVELEVGTGVGSGTAVGTVTIKNGGLLSVNNWTKFGGRPIPSGTSAGGGGYGVLNLLSGTFLKSGTGHLIFGDTIGEAEVNHSGGTLAVEAGELVIGGYRKTGIGTYRLTSGTVAVAAAAGVGRYGGSGALIMTGGIITKSGSGDFEVGSGWSTAVDADAIGNGNASISGGTLDVREGNLVISAGRGAGSSGTMAVDGLMASVRAPSIYVGKAALADGALDLKNGRIETVLSIFGAGLGGIGRGTVVGGEWLSDSFVIGDEGVGVLSQTGGRLSSTECILGRQLGGDGQLVVTGGTWANSGNLVVASSGSGVLTMTGGLVTVGGTLTKGTYGTINLDAGGTLQIGTGGTTGELGVSTLVNNGTLIFDRSDESVYSGVVTGTGAILKRGSGALTLTGTLAPENAVVVDRSLSVSSGTLAILLGGTGRLWVGSNGSVGMLAINGGELLNNDGWLGAEASGYGSAIVTSGTWANRRYLDVGASGTGVLVLQGGVVSSSNSVIGWNLGSVGMATINGGALTASNDLAIADQGTGTMLLRGGAVENNRTRIGYRSTGEGTAIVESGEWTNRDFFYVGVFGKGRLDLKGGVIRNTYSITGYDPGGTGIVEVSGGRWLNSDFLVVGRKGAGSMSIKGGYVEDVDGVLGYYAEGTGSALITGGTWANTGNLVVGLSGTGTLSMTGGLVTVGGTLSKGTYGTINLSPGGTLQIGMGSTTGVLATDLTNNGTLVFDRSDTSTYAGVLSGTGSLVKRGGGTLQLIGENTYSGGTLIGAGIVRVETDSALGSGPIVITDAARRIVLGDGVTVANNIVIDRPTGQIGRGVIEYDGTGVATVTSGTITILNNVPRGGEFGVIGSGTLRVESAIVASGSSAVVMRIGTAVFSGGGEYSVFRIGEGTVRLGRDDGVSRNALAQIGWVRDPSSAWLDLAGFDQSLTGIVRGLPNGTIGNSSTIRNSTLTLTGSSSFSGVIQDSIDGGTKQMCLAVDGGWLGLTGANTMTGSTTVKNGTLQLGHLNALPFSSVSVLSGGTLSLAPGLVTAVGGLKPNAGGLVDVGTGMITVSKGLSVLNAYAAIVTGRGDGAWDGASGITSSAAASSNGTRTVGWLENGNGSVTFAYAAAGDTNLDWIVDVLDVAKFITGRKYDSGRSATWAEGDFNYDGFADITDIADFLATGLYDAGNYSAPAGTIAAVPEPSVLGLVGVGAGVVGLMAARRKRKRVAGKSSICIDRRAA
jgi:autotransporter-associated beta strand protein/T5SS/PEP-CTERM-associated repeat protein